MTKHPLRNARIKVTKTKKKFFDLAVLFVEGDVDFPKLKESLDVYQAAVEFLQKVKSESEKVD